MSRGFTQDGDEAGSKQGAFGCDVVPVQREDGRTGVLACVEHLGITLRGECLGG